VWIKGDGKGVSGLAAEVDWSGGGGVVEGWVWRY